MKTKRFPVIEFRNDKGTLGRLDVHWVGERDTVATETDLLAAGYVPASRLLAVETELGRVRQVVGKALAANRDELPGVFRNLSALLAAPSTPPAPELSWGPPANPPSAYRSVPESALEQLRGDIDPVCDPVAPELAQQDAQNPMTSDLSELAQQALSMMCDSCRTETPCHVCSIYLALADSERKLKLALRDLPVWLDDMRNAVKSMSAEQPTHVSVAKLIEFSCASLAFMNTLHVHLKERP